MGEGGKGGEGGSSLVAHLCEGRSLCAMGVKVCRDVWGMRNSPPAKPPRQHPLFLPRA